MTATIDETTSYDEPGGTGPDKSGRRGRLTRWAILAAVLLIVVLVGALANRSPSSQPYDTAAAGPPGSRAIAAILGQRGVHVQRVATAGDAVTAAAGRPVTVVVPEPDLVPDVAHLTSLTASRIVLVDPGDDALTIVAPGVTRTGGSSARVLDPGCPWPAAQAAGRALVGGSSYTVRDDRTIAQCYQAAGAASLVVARDVGREIVVVGDGHFLTNLDLSDEGNAALAVNLMSAHDTVLWVLPRPGEVQPVGATGRSSLTSYLPDRLIAAFWTVALGVLLLGIAYSRRLGRVVTEPLPVVVRAAETVEGKARLYRAARARDRAAGWLRDAALNDIKPRAGVPLDATPPVLIDAVAARTGRPREDVAAALFGPAPMTDRDLVALADALDRLTAEVRRQ
ncbi:MAG: hypothetical protein QOC60_555 [Frankiaceae bacterium]|nr:hypothetical protein [Frankiaceae bacterium]